MKIAVLVKEAAGAGEVVLVSMGPASALEAMRKALAMGADRSVLVSDSGVGSTEPPSSGGAGSAGAGAESRLAGSDLVATSAVLAKVLQVESPDLILFGQQANDGDGAVLSAAVAERLRRPLISQAAELNVGDGKVIVKRQTEFGYDRIEAPLPAVVSVSDAINEPRYPSLKGIMGAKRKPQETRSAETLGLPAEVLGEAGSKTEVYAFDPPPPRGESVKIDADDGAAEKIVEFLEGRKLL